MIPLLLLLVSPAGRFGEAVTAREAARVSCVWCSLRSSLPCGSTAFPGAQVQPEEWELFTPITTALSKDWLKWCENCCKERKSHAPGSTEAAEENWCLFFCQSPFLVMTPPFNSLWCSDQQDSTENCSSFPNFQHSLGHSVLCSCFSSMP